MRKLLNSTFRWYLQQRFRRIKEYSDHPHDFQKSLLKGLIEAARFTEFGKKCDFKSIQNARQLSERIPACDYEYLKPDITRMMYGEKDVLWPGQVRWFSKSSGTTSDRSKFIPVSPQNLRTCHLKGGWDSLTLLYHNYPELGIFGNKNLVMGGSIKPFSGYSASTIGDVSAIMLRHLPRIARPFYALDAETALMENMEKKLERMVDVLPAQPITMIAGVPTWVVVLFRKILEKTGKNNILEVWPTLQAYMHGGVSFKPYREQFRNFLPDQKFIYQEIYNASEGFFSAQDDPTDEGMLLFLDNGIYYEFVPPNEWGKEHPKTVGLDEVQLGVNYALVITTNSGLWRYMPGDTVVFTSLQPYRIRVTGRTKQFVNAFGEEVMVDNTDQALAEACRQTGAIVSEYTVAPVYFSGGGKGSHEWLIEFEREPLQVEEFIHLLDANLQKINSDYEAKRHQSMALERLHLRILPKGTFLKWMKARGKFGAQNKVPRLANHRDYLDEILQFSE